MATIDLEDAYFNIPIYPTDRKYLRFSWENSLYEFTCLPFGYKLAPRTFTKILKPVYAALRFRGIRVVFYIDTLVIGKTAEQCSIHLQEVCEFLTRLGYTINIAKSQLNSSKTITFLEFVIDSESMTLSLPGSKIEKTVSHCKRLLLNPAPTVREVAQVPGLLVSAFRAVKYMKLFYHSTEMCKSELISCGAPFEDPCPLSVQCFAKELRNTDVQLQIDNTTAVYYINNMGGIHSPVINLLSRNIWEWRITRNLMG